jgi:hypothetical protein
MATVECLCPPKATGEVRHPDGDTIELRERLDFRGVLAARNAIALLKNEDPDVSSAEILATLTETYLLLGVRTWSVVDAKGKAVEVNNVSIRQYLFANEEAAIAIADEADDLYRERIIAPLVRAAQNSSPPTPTNDSISPTTGPASKTRKPSKRSSITTIPMADTEMTASSPGGDSSSSRNSA